MKRNYNQSALKAVSLIADLCLEYNRNESTILLINLVKAFQVKDLSSLTPNQLNKTFNFINKLTTIYLTIQQINTLHENDTEVKENDLQKAGQQTPQDFKPDAVIRNFFNKYALHESQLLSELLTNALLDSNLSQAKLIEVEAFQQDLDSLLKANHLLFQHEC